MASEDNTTTITTTITTVVDLDTAKSRSSVKIDGTDDLTSHEITLVVAAACRVVFNRLVNGVITPADDEGEEDDG